MTRVLVTRLDGAGDVLLAGPAVRAVAARSEVTLLCGPAGAAAGRLLPGVAEVLVWASPWVVNPAPPIDRAALDRFVDDLAARAFDEAVVLTSFHQSPLPTALLLRLAGVGRITGASIDYPGTLLDVRLRPGDGPGDDLPEDLPEPERALAIAAAAGYRLPGDDPGGLAVLPPPPVGDLLAPLDGRPYVVVHPGAAVAARRWPAEHHRQAAGLLAADGFAVVVTGGPDERALTAEVAAGAPGAVDLGGCTGLPELSAVLAGAEAVVVGNTGAAHLAAAVGTPVVSLFAPVVPAVRWRPYRVRQVLLGDQDAPCRDTRARDCPVPGHPCLADVTPEDVRDAVRQLRGLAPPQAPLPPPLLYQEDKAAEDARHVPFDLEAAASSPCLTPVGRNPVTQTFADPTPAHQGSLASTSRGVGTVLVTGAASGLGRAVAAAVTAAGGRALLVDRVAVEPAEGALAPAPRRVADSAVVDLADTRAAEEAIRELIARAGGVDAVVTAAGTDRCGALGDVPATEWEQVVAVNLFGTAAVIRAALPALKESRGKIVTVASTLGLRALPDATAYCASKFGVVGMTRALATELAGQVGVTLLVPGGMNTAFFDGRPDQYKPGPDAQLNDPADVAEAVVFALTRANGCELREMVVCQSTEPSWP